MHNQTHTPMYIHTHSYTLTHSFLYIHTLTNKYTHKHTHIHIRRNIHSHTPSDTLTHTHPHMHACSPSLWICLHGEPEGHSPALSPPGPRGGRCCAKRWAEPPGKHPTGVGLAQSQGPSRQAWTGASMQSRPSLAMGSRGGRGGHAVTGASWAARGRHPDQETPSLVRRTTLQA